MKKIACATAAAASMLAVSAISYAAAPSGIVIMGKPIQSDAAWIVKNGRVLVPLRAVTEPLGITAAWNAKSKTATIGKWSETVKLTVGQSIASYVKANQYNTMKLDASVTLVHDRVYVPLRFLSQFYGYRVEAQADTVNVTSPFSRNEQDILHHGDLGKARQFVMANAWKHAHYAKPPIEYLNEIEGFESTFFFPLGEANRFFLISDSMVSFYELQGEFFVITWQAQIPVGKKDTDELFMDNQVTKATGARPVIDGPMFFYRKSGIVNVTNTTAGTIGADGRKTLIGSKSVVGDEVKEQSGSLALTLPDETRAELNP
ncbi:copper amine oxidase N-terminal domain-containing protein [Paenibacillus rhizovicinus]|uniref:Copper amine oxidase N-terminal domain-containing protein n=1 Tax=Paenibacillus rhizovicinus TaxID=2704463 RepID=A0A6C0P5P7_9BACL|nr:copper amine oxidase N-terminal domain-containing protein [Paenibacillus rhizovicinus]QHW33880.1 copper amine oxidase N-terminal domain-containing protein [Paenibacillus rhizovicinus]